MEGDISNKTIVVLVVLTVIISVLGTVVVLNEVSNARIVIPEQPPTASQETGVHQAKVSLTIAPKPQRDSATGKVTLTIV